MTNMQTTPSSKISSEPDIPTLPVAPENSDLKAMTHDDLERERRRLVEECGKDFDKLTEVQLQRLAYIASTLRRRASGPPKAVKSGKSSATGKATLDDIL